MSFKKIELISPPPPIHWVGNGFRVHNFLPSVDGLEMERMSPFILLDYNSPHYFPPTDIPKGVGVHPHRGFETVTIAYSGKVEHKDSTGAGGVIGQGEVQWMTASSGILHKEFHEREWSKQGGIFQMVQLWVNLPAKDKMSPPKYQAITRDMMEVYDLDNNMGKVEIISGEYNGVKGQASTFTPIHLFNAFLNPKGIAKFSFPSSYTTFILAIKGNAIINNENPLKENHLALFKYEGEEFTLSTEEESIILILSGEPIPEPISARGPFVMNTYEEIIQAYEDFNSGKFGDMDF